MQQFKLKAVRLAVLVSMTSLSFNTIAADEENTLPEVKVQGNNDAGYSPAVSTSATTAVLFSR